MLVFKRKSIRYIFFAVVLFAFACKKTTIEENIIDSVVYQVDTVKLYSSSAEKNKQKSNAQYISILYSDLFGTGISNQEVAELSELNISIGDKTKANELLLSHYLSNSSVKMPTNQEMRDDIDQFVEDTYLKFYLRIPTEYERFSMVKLIKEDAGITPSIVYSSFTLSNEYYFY